MKKAFFPLFLIFMVILPLIFLRLADKHGAITNSIENESHFINFIDQEIIQNLSTEEKYLLTDCITEHSIDLKTSDLNFLSEKYSDGSFRCMFFNAVLNGQDWYQYTFSKRSNDDYYFLKIKTGVFEKLFLSESKSGNETVLFEHYIPMRQDEINTLQASMIGNHLIITLNNRILFHLLLEDKILPGKISFSAHASNRRNECKAEFSIIPPEIMKKMNVFVQKIPYIQLKELQ